MRRILFVSFTALFLAGTAHAATLQENRLYACSKTMDISPELQPAALLESSLMDIEARRFDLIYPRIAQLFATSLKPAEKTDTRTTYFTNHLSRASSFEAKYFDVIHVADIKSEILFASTNDEAQFECSKLPSYFANMAAAALMTQWMRNLETLPELQARASFVSHQSKVHEALLNNGLPMWPWELWLNGKRLGSSDWEPLFKTQWVVMRPTAGIEINTRNRASGNLEASVGLEPVGFVHYQNDDYNKWWGASLLVTSSTSAGIGLGGLLRWNNYVLGVTRHESNTAGVPASNFLFVGVELYDFANKQRGNLEQLKQLQQGRLQQILK
jgi:hypothetical protein